jgi:hypothetical protein
VPVDAPRWRRPFAGTPDRSAAHSAGQREEF